MSRNDEAIKLLVEGKAARDFSIKGRDYLVIDADAYDKAISLLKQPCQEEVEVENLETGEKATMIIDKPCDDSDEAELVKELRQWAADYWELAKSEDGRELYFQTADLIERLQAENKRLKEAGNG